MYHSQNPATGELLASYPPHSTPQMLEILGATQEAFEAWAQVPFAKRAELLKALAQLLRDRANQYGALITQEMGKVFKESVAEVNKCATLIDFYAGQGEALLAPEPIKAGFAKSYARYEPFGVLLAIMPWNFPFWQVLRFAVPNLMGGNGVLLKHAPNVFGCALAIEEAFLYAGFPPNLFRALMIEPEQASLLMEDPRLKGVTLTGSERAGVAVASKAGKELKKVILELGGSDPFVVLEDADLEKCCQTSVFARCFNAGQVCIASKRFIVVEPLYDRFLEAHRQIMESWVVGDPMAPQTQMGPMARADLMIELNSQVQQSLKEGARLVTGGKILDRPGHFYAPTLLAEVTPEMTCFTKELFGPVSSLVKAKDEEEAIRLANLSPYGLGASVWSRDLARAEKVAHRLESGMVFINSMTVSHPALPFGGVKRSGFGRECGSQGIREFQAVKTVVVA
ncbi:MAG: succinate-semialdehyde dehydrogenase [Candidatus Lambdaproteobacteria bacterium RIFOXYD1_FULL_56_27]|uniref:Succinate-semialdehyde dehydrogenase n=1 Tax=Candidatus Lambdaproteobacteria bacterium RIFOXYD2_FULL_56_26 TaxID=1817773 RepID=A0A1F6GUX2_9PROT|nr:MAG: succinate-semialdehyde dehydrogenase [Candidatus Lambdaproteobacteria bacterium RIFOXYD2_FULL_56_26]OGH02333.1 MAG: succinate-semialdehyde dehydrogenase [Candidatus Lambdaproteobacteria bacterium RIFOXYC1_FULL_56_13]OGH10104.1 MAG: succinate-semialdehyde dehydrogenase [Candidatus Lambdaproteobacteria bacterium RIFOXYD1_FULL_56_27]